MREPSGESRFVIACLCTVLLSIVVFIGLAAQKLDGVRTGTLLAAFASLVSDHVRSLDALDPWELIFIPIFITPLEIALFALATRVYQGPYHSGWFVLCAHFRARLSLSLIRVIPLV